MTFVYVASTPASAWLLVDRRLSSPGRRPIDTAIKLIAIETMDGRVLAGYAGLGATAGGTQPSEWMARTLRGVNLPLEQSLQALADACTKRLPTFLQRIGGHHVIIAVGFRKGEPRVYGIAIEARGAAAPKAQLTWQSADNYIKYGQRGAFFAAAGSGAVSLPRERLRSRELVRLLKAHDRGAVTPEFVASQLAHLNLRVSRADRTKQVSEKCIVAWRLKDGGGGHRFFNGSTPEADTAFPIISRGMDLGAVVGILMKHSMPSMIESLKQRQPLPDVDPAAINADLAKLPSDPDDSLR